MMMFVAMFHQQNQAAANHWLISYSLSADLNIKSPHPNFSEINTTTTSSKISNSTSTFLVVLEAIALLIVGSVFSGSHLRVGIVSQKQLHSFGSDLEKREKLAPTRKLPQKETIVFQPSIFRCYVFREGNKNHFGQKPLLVSYLFQRMVIFHNFFVDSHHSFTLMPTFCVNHPISSTGEIDIDVSPCVGKKTSWGNSQTAGNLQKFKEMI